MSETWRPIPGFPQALASSGGEIIGPSGIVLRPTKGNRGYMTVTLRQAGRPKCCSVHGLVALAFIGPRPPGLHVAHLNGSKVANQADNLAYVSAAENMGHKVIHGTRQVGERAGHRTLSLPQARAIKADRRSAKCVAADFGVSKTTVNSIRQGATWADALAESAAHTGEAR